MSVLTNCGWILSSPKHHPMALQKIFLGLTVNSVSMEFEIPDEKLEKTNFLLLEKVDSAGIMPVRLLASFLGLLNSFSRALGQVVRLMTRQLYKCLGPAHNSPEEWNANTSLSLEAKVEL